jgi:predicted secreted hydrolase
VIRRLILILLIVLVFLAAGLMTAIFIFRRPTPLEFQQATAEQPVTFPRDEAAHFRARTDWWYYTGFLNAQDGQQYGFELVFFKSYVPPAVRIANLLPLNWASNPIYFAHFALSDQQTQEHTFFEQMSFPQFWNAGARADRFEVWNGDWRAWGDGIQHHLRADGGRYRLRLDLETLKAPVLHGPDGGGVIDMGQAGTSYYYSRVDLEGTGLLYIDGQYQAVLATAWMDHQWGSWDLHQGFDGWDWFSLRLDDGSRAMLFNFRDELGGLQPQSTGTWITPEGAVQHLESDDYLVYVLDQWTSPQTGGTYPVAWQVIIPEQGFEATVEATFPEQELPIHLGPIYWEGTVTILVDGASSGKGFAELTGYAPENGH